MSDDNISWQEISYSDALEMARRERKLLIVHFTSPERPLCKTMQDETLASPDVVRLSRAKFINLRLDAHRESALFDTLIGGQGALATCIVDATGDIVASLPGFADARSFLDFLETARSGLGRLTRLRAQAKQDRKSVALRLALAEAYDQIGSPRRAEEEYGAVIEQAGAMARSTATSLVQAVGHERLARLLAAKGRSTDARAELERVHQVDPEGTAGPADRLLLTEALVLSLERRLSESVARLKELLARFASSTECEQALFTLGSIEHELRDDAAGLAHLEQLVAEHPQSRWCRPARLQIEHIKSPEPDHRH